MSRPRLGAGEVGVPYVVRLPSGRWQAEVRFRMHGDEHGPLRKLKVSATTEEAARAELTELLEAILHPPGGYDGELTPQSTVAQLCAAWYASVESENRVVPSTLSQYRTTIKTLVLPRLGELRLEELERVSVLDRIIGLVGVSIDDEVAARMKGERPRQPKSAQQRARTVLNLAFRFAVVRDAMTKNPVPLISRKPRQEDHEVQAYSARQIQSIRKLLRVWAQTAEGHTDTADLIDAVDFLVGSGLRIGEAMALRRLDVDVTVSPALVSVTGTVAQTPAGYTRKDRLKRARQKRTIAVASIAAQALRRRLTVAGQGDGAYLWATGTGRPVSPTNIRRTLRAFRDAMSEELTAAGVDLDNLTPHAFRRTAATLIESQAGIGLAADQLGHANESITNEFYVARAPVVDPEAAEALDRALRIAED